MTAALHVVLPGGIDDPAAPSGGNTYDRRVLTGLAATRDVHEIAVAAAWPYPAEADRAVLAGELARLPRGATVLLDGLVAGAVPELLEPLAGRLRLVVLVHLPLGDETGLAPAAAAELTAREGRTIRAAAAVVATSSGAGRRLEKIHGLPAGTVHVAPPGVDPAPLGDRGRAGAAPDSNQAGAVPDGNQAGAAPDSNQAAAAPDSNQAAGAAPDSNQAAGAAPDGNQAGAVPDGGRLVCVAAVTPRKAQDVLVEALVTLADLPWTCTLVGALDRAPGFVTRVRELAAAVPGRVEFAGTRTGDALAGTYHHADLLVLPSLAETYGMVVTEALARGVPVLGTQVAGVPEALGTAPDGRLPGALVPPGDPRALAATLRRWLTEPVERAGWRAAAAARREHLRGWDFTTRLLSEVLDV
ncbi:glycosyltransferase family 4 protein [Actinoplanes sp. NPDC049599]|uniref:glycosyltransferase family 4 protein n=1 Tax=Actinoplanes sp. NPDC049599 TaxID=3363903 RepID=UPI00379544FE